MHLKYENSDLICTTCPVQYIKLLRSIREAYKIQSTIHKINKVLLYSIGNYIQDPVIYHNGKEYKNVYIYLGIIESLCCTPEIQHCNKLYFNKKRCYRWMILNVCCYYCILIHQRRYVLIWKQEQSHFPLSFHY